MARSWIPPVTADTPSRRPSRRSWGGHRTRSSTRAARTIRSRWRCSASSAKRREGHAYPGVADTLAALEARDGVVQSLLTGNIEANAALKVGAFGLERWLDFEVGAYGSDPHDERSELVAVARERVTAKYGEPTRAVLVGDTPHDVQAAREAGARAVAVATPASPTMRPWWRPDRTPSSRTCATRRPRWRRSWGRRRRWAPAPPFSASRVRAGYGVH
jgi:phosphoglycolate phosphatase-like HAD superfamily hydrolase